MVNNLECSLSKKCGNCPLGSYTYQETIKIKQDYVNKLFKDASINKKIDNMSIAQNKYRQEHPNSTPSSFSKYWVGKTFSEEHKRKISEANKRKPVVQYTKDLKFVAEYASISDAKQNLGVAHCHISACCLGKRNISNGYIWVYKEDICYFF